MHFTGLDWTPLDSTDKQRLAGATLLIFANKQDIAGAMTLEEIRDVSIWCLILKLSQSRTKHKAKQSTAEIPGPRSAQYHLA